MKVQQDEQALLERFAQNDKKAIETVYQQNYKTIHSLVTNNSGSADDAKDIFQESVIILYEKLKNGQLELECKIKTYLYAVARRLWLKRLQQQGRFMASADSLEETVPVETEIDDHEKVNAEFELMKKALAKLGEPCKSLLEAYYFQQQNMAVIAKQFGYTNANNAKTQKYKCLMRLKKIFFSQYKNGNGDE
ncbi:MAG: sigma-70 family RNA polymerase sigma factor [Chitinophagaceae bacterium]